MAIQNRNALKVYFETDKEPTEAQFAELIDSLICLKGTGDNIATASSVDSSKTLLIIDPADGNVYKTTLASIITLASTKNKTWTIKDSPSGNPTDMQKPSGNALDDASIHNVTPLDVMTRNNMPLQWKTVGVTYNSVSGFNFSAIGGLQDGDVITIAFI